MQKYNQKLKILTILGARPQFTWIDKSSECSVRELLEC